MNPGTPKEAVLELLGPPDESSEDSFHYLIGDAIKKNMLALKKAFKTSVIMQYVNFMPGESLPKVDKGMVKSLFDYGEEIGVAIGAPDLSLIHI